MITKTVEHDKTIFVYENGGEKITVEFDNEGATTIESNLKEELPKDIDDVGFNNAIDGFESLLMAVVGQGIGISTREWDFAIQAALDGIGNNF